jgi:hypothetical protein
VLALTYAIAVVEVAATTLAVATATLVAELDAGTLAELAGTSIAVALASAMGMARVLIASEDSPAIAARTVGGAAVVAAGAVVCLGVFGPEGVAAFAATCALALFALPASEEP